MEEYQKINKIVFIPKTIYLTVSMKSFCTSLMNCTNTIINWQNAGIQKIMKSIFSLLI